MPSGRAPGSGSTGRAVREELGRKKFRSFKAEGLEFINFDIALLSAKQVAIDSLVSYRKSWSFKIRSLVSSQ